MRFYVGTAGARMLEFEIAILKRVSHPFIILLKEVFETSKKCFIVMECCRGGTLQDVVRTRPFPPNSVDTSLLLPPPPHIPPPTPLFPCFFVKGIS